jgi:hypothetical protein
MARSAKATESFRLVAVKNKNAQGKKSLKFPGVMLVSRTYTDGSDSQGGDWIQLCPGLFYQKHADRTSGKKGGRTLNAQFEDIDVYDSSLPRSLDRIDYTTN